MWKGNLLKIILIILYCIIIIDNYRYIYLSIIAICIHEGSHILYLKRNSINSIDLKFSILGFKIDLYEDLSNNKVLFLYLIGSLSNILVSIIVFVFNTLLNNELLNDFCIINVVIGIVNLIPAFPLDGIIVLKNILFRILGYRIVEIISIVVSFVSGFIVFLLGLYFYYLSLMRLNITYIVICLFVFISTYNEYRIFRSIDKVNTCDYIINGKSIRSVLIPLEGNHTLIDMIRLYNRKNIDIIYIINNEFEVVDILTMKGIIGYYNMYGNVNIRDYCK